MKRTSNVGIGLCVAGALFGATQLHAQGGGNWSTNRYDLVHSGTPKSENSIKKEALNGDFKFLWKLKLGNEQGDTRSYSEPLLIPKLINAQGFKDFVIWAGKQDVYAVDSELGKVLWTKHYDVAPGACPSNLSMTMEAPLVINFGARRAPGSRPTPQGPTAVKDRRVGGSAGGGGFGLKGLYVLTPDGYLHEQVITTGVDFAPAVKFLPGPAGAQKGLNISSKTIYTATASGCAGAKNGIYSLDMTSASYPLTSYETKAVPQLTAMGPTLGEGVAYVVTGKGVSDAAAGVYPNSVAAIAGGKPKAWYTAAGPLRNVTPVAFTYKQKKLLVAPGKDGSFVVLDADNLGGADHHTVLAESGAVGGSMGEAPDALSVWTDASSDTTWVFASIQGPVAKTAKFASGNVAASHGSVVAFKLEGDGDKLTMTPAWVSHDMVSPTPPVAVNGLVIALAQGSASVKAKLLVLDAATGKELYTSGDGIGTYARMAGISVGDGHVFFVTHDGTLYSYGIGIEH